MQSDHLSESSYVYGIKVAARAPNNGFEVNQYPLFVYLRSVFNTTTQIDAMLTFPYTRHYSLTIKLLHYAIGKRACDPSDGEQVPHVRCTLSYCTMLYCSSMGKHR